MPSISKIKINGTTYDLAGGGTSAVTSVNGKTGTVVLDKSDIGLGNVPNVTTDNQTPTVTEASDRTNLTSGDTLKTIISKIKKWFTDLKDLAFIAKDGTSSTKYLRGDGTWQAFPTIPTVNNGTLTINQNSTQKGTFTANQSGNTTIDLTDTTYSVATQSANGLMSSTDKTKLDNADVTAYTGTGVVSVSNHVISTTAEVNQNAFSNVKVGDATIQADSKTDTLELVAGSNVTLTPDVTNDKVTIAASQPTVNNGKLTITENYVERGSFTANSNVNTTINLTGEVNQNAFSKIKVTQGQTTTDIDADTKTDTLNLIAGTNITLTPDTTNDSITISSSGSTSSVAWGGITGDIADQADLNDNFVPFNKQITDWTKYIQFGNFKLDDDGLNYSTEYGACQFYHYQFPRIRLLNTTGSGKGYGVEFDTFSCSPSALYKGIAYVVNATMPIGPGYGTPDSSIIYPSHVLWTNSSPDATFAAQTITFDKDINYFRWYEIVYKCKGNFSNSDQKCKSTGLVPINTGTCLQRNFQYSETRDVTAPTYNSSTGKTSFAFAACVRYTSYGSSTTSNQNTICVPYQIIGHI